MGLYSPAELVINTLLEVFARAVGFTIFVYAITAFLKKKSRIIRGLRKFFLSITTITGACFAIIGLIHAVGIKEDIKGGETVIFGARDTFYMKLMELNKQEREKENSRKPEPFGGYRQEEVKTVPISSGMRIAANPEKAEILNLEIEPQRDREIRLTFKNARFRLESMELMNPYPEKQSAYDKLDYHYLAQDYYANTLRKKYQGDFCIQLYDSAVITNEMKEKSGNCDIITLAGGAKTHLRMSLATEDKLQPSYMEVEYLPLAN